MKFSAIPANCRRTFLAGEENPGFFDLGARLSEALDGAEFTRISRRGVNRQGPGDAVAGLWEGEWQRRHDFRE
jgi:hypothetical protein